MGQGSSFAVILNFKETAFESDLDKNHNKVWFFIIHLNAIPWLVR